MADVVTPGEVAAAAEQRAAIEAADPRAELDAQFAAAFEAHDPGKGAADDAAPEPVEAKNVREIDPEEGRSEGAERAGETVAEAPAQDDEAYEKALLALRYSGVPSAVTKNLSRDELIAWGNQAADRRAKTEAALEERAQRIRELEEVKKAPAEPPKAADWTPHLKALAETLGLEPEIASKAFGPALDAVAHQIRTEFSGRLDEQRAAEGRRQISEQVQRLSELHPKLKTDRDLVSKLNGKALLLWKGALESGSPYESAEACYNDAEKLVLGTPTAHLAAKRRNGSAPPPEGRVEDRTMDSDDAFMSAMDRIEAGDRAGARRAGAQVRWGREQR